MDQQSREDNLKELRRILIEQEAKNREFFEKLGTSPQELLRLLQEESRYPKTVWETLQREKQRLLDRIDDKVQSVQQMTEKKKKAVPPHIKGHWIFIR